MSASPTSIAIDHDDYHASHVGLTSNGRQFFLTTPFVPQLDSRLPGRDSVARFIFDADGCLLEATIDDLGSREDRDAEHAQRVFDTRLHELGAVNYSRIVVRPFAVEHFGTTFGLITHPPAKAGDGWWVSLEPGNYMAFHEPWESGAYDT